MSNMNTSTLEQLVEQLAAIDGIMRDDIEIHDDTVTTYVATGELEAAQSLDDVSVEVLEEYKYEYLISVAPRNIST